MFSLHSKFQMSSSKVTLHTTIKATSKHKFHVVSILFYILQKKTLDKSCILFHAVTTINFRILRFVPPMSLPTRKFAFPVVITGYTKFKKYENLTISSTIPFISNLIKIRPAVLQMKQDDGQKRVHVTRVTQISCSNNRDVPRFNICHQVGWLFLNITCIVRTASFRILANSTSTVPISERHLASQFLALLLTGNMRMRSHLTAELISDYVK